MWGPPRPGGAGGPSTGSGSDLHQRATTTSNEPADLLRKQRIYFIYASCIQQ